MMSVIEDLLYRVLASMIRVIVADEQRKFLNILNVHVRAAQNGRYGISVPFDEVWDIATAEYLKDGEPTATL